MEQPTGCDDVIDRLIKLGEPSVSEPASESVDEHIKYVLIIIYYIYNIAE